MAASSARVPISALPLPLPSHVLTQHLTPDPLTPDPAAFRKALAQTPSIQRRSRLLAPNAHFSYVAPCPLEFPYRIERPQESGDEPSEETETNYVEKWLAEHEALHEVSAAEGTANGTLKKFVSQHSSRNQPRELLGLAETALRDCLPHLDVGDALHLLGSPSLLGLRDSNAEETQTNDSAAVAARQELINVLGGHTVLMSSDSGETAAVEGDVAQTTQWAPWALRYSGHQFGTWAGQLGDGRAISILSTPHPDDPDTVYELQLKGAGRTPFSRTADGLAVLRSSIREFLCSEAMHALGIPTTRALALVHLPTLRVERERSESGCIVTRLAPSFLRIGSFEALNPPARMFFLGGGQQEADLDALRVLGEWVAHLLRLAGRGGDGGGEGGEGEAWGKELVLEVARRNGRMVAAWQAYGFMHGVINTDNVSVLGLTIDYGPYAFMDVFDPFHICNHSDGEGRYSYKYQPSMIIYALRALLDALAPLIGAEAERGAAVRAGWADGASADQIAAWTKAGSDAVKPEMERVAEEACAIEYGRLMHKRLALRRHDTSDEAALVRPLLALMQEHRLDFHGAFRTLCAFRPRGTDEERDALIARILEHASEPERLDRAAAEEAWRTWLAKYAVRIESERDEWVPDAEGKEKTEIDAEVDVAREAAARAANPRFVLRQWMLEEVIKKVEGDPESGRRILGKVLKMACSPFEPWGAEDLVGEEDTLDAETREERRFCGMGQRRYLGFQCSCSS